MPESWLFEGHFSTFFGTFLGGLQIAEIHIFTMDFDVLGIQFRFFSRCPSGSDFGSNLGVVLGRFLLHFGTVSL